MKFQVSKEVREAKIVNGENGEYCGRGSSGGSLIPSLPPAGFMVGCPWIIEFESASQAKSRGPC